MKPIKILALSALIFGSVGALLFLRTSDIEHVDHKILLSSPKQVASVVRVVAAKQDEAMDKAELVPPPPSGALFVPPRSGPDEFDPFQSPFPVGIYKLDDVAAVYERNILAAREGDGEAMRMIARVMYNCAHAWSVRDEENAMKLLNKGTLTLYEYEETLPQLANCAPIWEDQQKDWSEMASEGYAGAAHLLWLGRADKAGNKLASVVFLQDLPFQNEELAALLDELVDTLDPFVLEVASKFVSVRESLDDRHVSRGLRHLACIHSEVCDEAIHEALLRVQYTEDIADEIIWFAESFKGRAQSDLSFVEINQSRPYRASPQVVEAYRQAARAKGTEELRGVKALLQTVGSNDAKSVGNPDEE